MAKAAPLDSCEQLAQDLGLEMMRLSPTISTRLFAATAGPVLLP